MTAATAPPEERLAWEERQRPRAALAALLAGILSVAGGIFNSLALSDAPRALFMDSLDRAARPGPIGPLESLRIAQYEYFKDHFWAILVGAALIGLAGLAASGLLTYLSYASRNRAERFPRIALYLPFVGGVLVFLGSILTALGSLDFVNALLDTQRTVDAVQDAGQSTLLIAGQIIVQFGGLALAGAYVLVSLNAMRVGLLTRGLGVIGIIVGLLVVLPVALLSQLLQPLWLFAMTWLLLGRWPGGVPPAWRTGRAEPWPSNAQLRQQRGAAQGRRPAGRVSDEPAPETPAAAAKPHPASKKRKRKRRG